MRTISNKPTLALIAFIVFIDMVGIGLMVPVMPGLIAEVSTAKLQDAALIGGALHFAYSFMLFICAPIVGGLSDRFGRRPVLLGALTAMGIDYLLMAWAPTLFWLFLGRIVSGAMGATWAASNSCIADLFPPEERAAKFGLIGAAGAAGFVMGPALGGLLGEYGLRLPFLAAGILALGGALLGYLRFAETLPPEGRRRFTIARANPLGTLIQMSKIPAVMGMIAVLLLFQLANQSTHITWAFYLIEKFQWSPWNIGVATAVYGLLLAAVQGGLTGPAIARFGAIRTATIGALAILPAYALLAFAWSGPMVYAGAAIGALAGLFFPAAQGLMSARVGPDAQGELQGAIASTISIAAIAGPLMMPPVFAAFSDGRGLYFPGAPFGLALMLSIAGLLLFYRLVRQHFSSPG